MSSAPNFLDCLDLLKHDNVLLVFVGAALLLSFMPLTSRVAIREQEGLNAPHLDDQNQAGQTPSHRFCPNNTLH
jgi:hypothetical protein